MWEGERGTAGEAIDILINRPDNRDICLHYHKHDDDHKDTECRGAR